MVGNQWEAMYLYSVVIGPGGVHHVAGELPEAEQQHCGALGFNQLAELCMTNSVVIGPGGFHHVAGELLEAEQQHCGALGFNQ
jgi:hypothetical protein